MGKETGVVCSLCAGKDGGLYYQKKFVDLRLAKKDKEIERLQKLGNDVVRAHDNNSGNEPSLSVFERAMDLFEDELQNQTDGHLAKMADA